MSLTKLDLTVVGGAEEIKELLLVLGKIQWLGMIGSSRTIPVHVDGDGSARLKFFVKNVPKELDGQKIDPKWKEDYTALLELVTLDKKQLKKVGDGDDFETQYIGE